MKKKESGGGLRAEDREERGFGGLQAGRLPTAKRKVRNIGTLCWKKSREDGGGKAKAGAHLRGVGVERKEERGLKKKGDRICQGYNGFARQGRGDYRRLREMRA